MYNPAGLAGSIRETGIWGPAVTPSINTNIVFDPIPTVSLDLPFPILRIAPNDSVPSNATGPTPGSNQSWWDNFRDSVENGAAWVADQAVGLVSSDPAQTAPPPTAQPGTNGATMLLVAGAAAILLLKARS